MARTDPWPEFNGGTPVAHTHSQTHLARLGFQDPDKSNPRHDLACRYLSRQEVVFRLAAATRDQDTVGFVDGPYDGRMNENSKWVHDPEGEERRTWQRRHAAVVRPEPELIGYRIEAVVSDGRYHIGFLDLVTAHRWVWDCRLTTHLASRRRSVPPDHWEAKGDYPYSDFFRGPDDLVVDTETVTSSVGHVSCFEVKIAKVPLADAIRQIKLYRHYLSPMAIIKHEPHQADSYRFFLATDYDVTADDVAALANEKIGHIRLGAGFGKWIEDQAGAAKPAAGIEL